MAFYILELLISGLAHNSDYVLRSLCDKNIHNTRLQIFQLNYVRLNENLASILQSSMKSKATPYIYQ